jgi:ABC-type phosphate transport system substrate-binding protein
MNRRSAGRRSPWRLAAAVGLVVALGVPACTLLLDRSSTQCSTDNDCARFGGHPFCQSGVCVSSGLGPSDCFFGQPQQPGDFANQCSSAQCLAFDDCQHLGLCAGSNDADGGLIAPPPPDAGAGGSGGAGGGAGAGGSGGGASLPSCLDATDGRPQIVVITGSSNFPPLLAKLAPLIMATGYTPVYQVTSSCRGVRAMFGTQTNDRIITDPAPGSTGQAATYFSNTGAAVPCTLGPDGAAVDIGESDIFSSTCSGFGPPGNGVGEFLGPIQAMVFVVPGRSQQTAISEAAARIVFGRGGQGGIDLPWTNPALYFVRNGNTGTQLMIGRAISVPAGSFWGIDRGTARNVDALMRVITDATAAEQAIGIISSDYYDSDRGNLKALAYRAADQECAYLPDSTDVKKDKRNIRDGHYPIWGPLHFFATVTNGVPQSLAAQAFVSVVSVPNVQKELLDAFIGASLVPDCAMTVQRDSELGALSSYAPPYQCGCYFEASPDVNGAPPPDCTPCRNGNDCTDPNRPACNLGYCEAQ